MENFLLKQTLDFGTSNCLPGSPESLRNMWVVVKLMVPFGNPKYSVPYYNRDPKRDHNLDNHPCGESYKLGPTSYKALGDATQY